MTAPRVTRGATRAEHVGPVLEPGALAEAVIAAIRDLNEHVFIEDRGAYLRVLVPHRCVVTRSAIETALGRDFRLPSDLEAIMLAFKGGFRVSADEASWSMGVQP